MLIQAEENRMQFAQFTLAVCFIGVINSMSDIAMHEYKALTQFNWQMQSLCLLKIILIAFNNLKQKRNCLLSKPIQVENP